MLLVAEPVLGEEEKAALREVIDCGWITMGDRVRAFERRFVAHVGLTPVHYRRLSRFRGVLRLYSEGVRDWAGLAAATGFSDQSHLVRDFGTFAGLTPTAWAAAQAGRAGFIQDGEITTL